MDKPALKYDPLTEELLAAMLLAADPLAARFEHVVSVNLSAVLIVVRALLEGQHHGLVTRIHVEDDTPPW